MEYRQPATLETIVARGCVKDSRAYIADADPYRDRARAVAHRPECEGYLNDEWDYWYVPSGNYLCRLVGEGRTDDQRGLSPQAVADGWFDGLRSALHDAYWREKRLIFEPLEAAALDVVVIDGPITRGRLYRTLVEIQRRDSCFRHSPRKSLAQNAHEAVGVPLYAQMISLKAR